MSVLLLLAVAAFLAIGLVRTATEPLWITWLTWNIDARVRATVISMDGQVNALGQIVGGLPMGYVGTLFSLRGALVAVSIILSPVLLLFGLAARKVKGEVLDCLPHQHELIFGSGGDT